MVPKAGLEPARLTPPPPQDGVSTNSTTSAILLLALTTLNALPRRYFIRYQLVCMLTVACLLFISHFYCHQQVRELNSQVHLFVEEQPAVLFCDIVQILGKTAIGW